MIEINLDRLFATLPQRSNATLTKKAGSCGKGWEGMKGACQRAKVKEVVHKAGHVAEHLGENVAAWGVGKVIGGAIAQVAIKHGFDPTTSTHIAETAVQALSATLIHARHKENRNAKELGTYFAAQSAAAYFGKFAHSGIDDALLGGDATVRKIAAAASGKGVGIGVASGAKNTLDRMVKRVNVRSDADTRTSPLTPDEHEALFELSLFGILEEQGKRSKRSKTRSDANEPLNPKLWARCQAAAKRKFRVHPSAYSNGWASQEYKRLGGKWRSDRSDDLRQWFKESWKAINSSGAIVGECGSGETKGKPKCLPENKARSLSKEERAKLAKRKQKKDPDKARSGKPIMVSSDRADDGWLVYFGGRRTPIAVSASSRSEAISKARKLKRRGGDEVASARKANESERKTAAKGGWIRTGPNGEAPGKSKLRGHGPKPKNV